MAKSLLKSTGVVSSMTLLSRVMGFIRDMINAQLFGASIAMDAFLIAFKIPNFMRRLFAEGAFSQAFVPVLAEQQQQKSHDDVRLFIARTAGTLMMVLLIITIVAELAAPLLVAVFAPGFIDDPTRFHLASDLLRVTFPYLFLISLTAFAGAIMNTQGRFWVPAFTPVLLNLSMIIAATVFAPRMSQPIVALAWGVFFAGVLQLLFQLPFLMKMRMLPRPQLSRKDEGVNRVLRLMVPAMFGVSVVQIGIMIDTLFASFLPAGSVTWLYLSDRITSLPLGVFGVAIATVVLPHLSRQKADASPQAFSRGLDWAIRSVLLIALPAMLGLLILSGPLLVTLFNYGEFSLFDVMMAQRSLMAFSVGVPGFMLIKTLATGFYAGQNIKTPVKFATIAVGMNIILNACLILPLAHAGLALATALSSSLNAALLFQALLRREIFKPNPGWLKFGTQLLLANGAMSVVLWWQHGSLSTWIAWGWQQRCLHLAFLMFLATTAYFSVLGLSGFRLRQLRLEIS